MKQKDRTKTNEEINGPTRVAIYTRISTDEEHQPYSLEAQRERLGSYVKSQENWALVRQFTDQMTGSTLDRPGLDKALLEGQLGRYDLLLVYRVDRLSRSVRGLAQILEELDRFGVVFRSATEPFDTGTPAGRMMVQMLGVFAEFERATIIDRVVAGMERKAARGGWCGGSRPFGYNIEPQSGFLVVNEDESPLISVIFDLYLNKRLGSQAVAMSLNERGHRTKAQRPWSHMSVLTVLRNRAYVGDIYFRGEYHPAPHKQLIDRATFDAANALLVERGEDHAKRASNPSDYLLASKVVCSKCGKHFVGSAATGNMYRYTYYTCFSRARYGVNTCDAERLPAQELETKVLESLLKTYDDQGVIRAAVDEAFHRAEAEKPQIENELRAVETEIRKAELNIDKYLRTFEDGSMPESVCGPRLQTLGDQVAKLRTRREELLCGTEAVEIGPPTDEELEGIRAGLRKTVTEGPPPELKALMQKFVEEIRVESRSSIYPVFRLPAGEQVRAVYRSVPPTVCEITG